MSYSVAFLGELTFRGGSESPWLDASASGAGFDDWPDALAWGDGQTPDTVRDALDAIPLATALVEHGGGRVKLRALLDKDDYVDRRRAIAAAFREAAKHGGEGELLILGWVDYPGTLAYRVDVRASGASTCTELDEAATSAAEKSAGYAELEAIVAKAMETQVASLPAAQGLLLSEATARVQAEVIARLRALEPGRVLEAAGTLGELLLTPSYEPVDLGAAFASGGELVDALEHGSPKVHLITRVRLEVAAIRVLAVVDPAAGRELSRALLASNPPAPLAVAASTALAGGGDVSLDEALAALASAVPEQATVEEPAVIRGLAIVATLAAHPSPEATARILAELGTITGGPLAGEASWKALDHKQLAMSFALSDVLARRGGGAEVEAALHTLWIDHPSWLLRNHERVYDLGRDDLKRRLAALLGVDARSEQERRSTFAPSQKHVVGALVDTDPNAAERSDALLDRPRNDGVAIDAIRWVSLWLAGSPGLRSPAWEQWLRRAATREPWLDNERDPYEQARVQVLGAMLEWKMPEAGALVAEHLDTIYLPAACEILTKSNDPSAVPRLREKLAKLKKKSDRALVENAVATLSGETPMEAKPTEPQGNHISLAPSGRAACRTCKEKIAKGELRFGESTPNVFSDSGEPSFRWYHLRCAAEKKAAIFGRALEAYAGEVLERAALVAAVDAAMAKKKKEK